MVEQSPCNTQGGTLIWYSKGKTVTVEQGSGTVTAEKSAWNSEVEQ